MLIGTSAEPGAAPNRFCIVDVFAETRYGGNQLAVFLLDSPLAAAEMQAITREIGFSESTFVTPAAQADGSFKVRIFTPAREVPFAGHPVLGTAHVIRATRLADGDTVALDLAVGVVPVRAEAGEGGIYWMTHPRPEFGATLPGDTLARVLGLPQGAIDARFPVEQVSTGLPHIIVPLASLTALKQARVRRDEYFALIENLWAKNILVFAPEAHEPGRDLSIRMFADYLGIAEDPATGSGNGCLMAYLSRHRYWGSPTISVRSEQGYEIGRPSLLYGRASQPATGYLIEVGGRVIPVARGTWGA